MRLFSESCVSLVSMAITFLSGRALAQQGDPMNNINDLCTINFYSDTVQAMVCVRDGTSTTFTTSSTQYLRSNIDHVCCETSNTCMLSNASTPQVGCYDPATKSISTWSDGGACKLSGNSCSYGSSGIKFSTSGVTKYTGVKDGKGVADGAGKSSVAVLQRPAGYTYVVPAIAAALLGAGATVL